MLKNSEGCVRAPVDFDVFYGVERIVLKDVVFNPENRGIYTQSDSPKKSSRNIWSLAVVSVDQRY